MPFKANLLKKIRIDELAESVVASIGPPGSGKKIDREAMRSLLAESPFTHRSERDLELYLRPVDGDVARILVLDNELPLYRSTAADVAMRKSPTVREMISIGNIIKILNDKDIIETKREDSVREIQAASLEGLDLSYTSEDIAELAREGKASIDMDQPAGVDEALTLFAELLGYTPAPAALCTGTARILTRRITGAPGETLHAPVIIHGTEPARLFMLEGPISSQDREAVETVRKLAIGRRAEPSSAVKAGHAVFDALSRMVVSQTTS
jgi:hypothetical protein